jgi:hypothetical protein
MVDRTELHAQYRKAVLVAAAIATSPIILFVVAWLLAADATPDGPGSGTIDPLILVVFAVVAVSGLAPLVFLRWLTRSRPPNTAPEAAIASLAMAELALWEIFALMGFVAFVLGATWTVFIGSVLVTYLGFAYSFPRWETWDKRADEIDAGFGADTIISS